MGMRWSTEKRDFDEKKDMYVKKLREYSPKIVELFKVVLDEMIDFNCCYLDKDTGILNIDTDFICDWRYFLKKYEADMISYMWLRSLFKGLNSVKHENCDSNKPNKLVKPYTLHLDIHNLNFISDKADRGWHRYDVTKCNFMETHCEISRREFMERVFNEKCTDAYTNVFAEYMKEENLLNIDQMKEIRKFIRENWIKFEDNFHSKRRAKALEPARYTVDDMENQKKKEEGGV